MSRSLDQARRALRENPTLADLVCAIHDRQLAAENSAPITSPRAAYEAVVDLFVDHEVEEFAVVALDVRHRVLDRTILTRGSASFTIVDPAQVLRWALTRRRTCSAIIVAHSHPSGDPTPSQQDAQVTSRLQRACETVSLKLIDHIIVAGTEFHSFAAAGAL